MGIIEGGAVSPPGFVTAAQRLGHLALDQRNGRVLGAPFPLAVPGRLEVRPVIGKRPSRVAGFLICQFFRCVDGCGNEYQPTHLLRALLRQFDGNLRTGVIAQKIDGADFQRVEDLTHRRRVIGDLRRLGRRVRFAEPGRVRRNGDAVPRHRGQQAGVNTARAWAQVKTHQRHALGPRRPRDAIVDLAETAVHEAARYAFGRAPIEHRVRHGRA